MKKQKTIFAGVLLAAFLMISLPAISAQNSEIVKSNVKSKNKLNTKLVLNEKTKITGWFTDLFEVFINFLWKIGSSIRGALEYFFENIALNLDFKIIDLLTSFVEKCYQIGDFFIDFINSLFGQIINPEF